MRPWHSAPARRALALAIALAAIAGGCSPILRAQQVVAAPQIHRQLTAPAERYRDRVTSAMREAGARYGEWLGPPPREVITVADRAGRAPATALPAGVTIDLPGWSAPATMDIESAVAYALARTWWPDSQPGGATATVVNGAAWYLQSLVVERLFDLRYLSPGHSADGVRYFGGAVPWAIPSLTLGRSTVGLGRAEFLRSSSLSARWPASARRLPASVDHDAVRGALAFGTLERYLTWPVLQGALHAWVRRAAEGPMSQSEIAATMSAAAGQDLSWFFTAVFDTPDRFNYALESFSTGPASEPCANGPCYRTRAHAVRLGEAQFTGASRPASEAFESGDAMTLRVRFADGQDATARWDGRQATRTFEFDSRAPAVSARLDPDRTLLLDENYLDDRRGMEEPTNVPVEKWVARWAVWLQDAMLAYSSLF